MITIKMKKNEKWNEKKWNGRRWPMAIGHVVGVQHYLYQDHLQHQHQHHHQDWPWRWVCVRLTTTRSSPRSSPTPRSSSLPSSSRLTMVLGGGSACDCPRLDGARVLFLPATGLQLQRSSICPLTLWVCPRTRCFAYVLQHGGLHFLQTTLLADNISYNCFLECCYRDKHGFDSDINPTLLLGTKNKRCLSSQEVKMPAIVNVSLVHLSKWSNLLCFHYYAFVECLPPRRWCKLGQMTKKKKIRDREVYS